jgi:hypothetical protein
MTSTGCDDTGKNNRADEAAIILQRASCDPNEATDHHPLGSVGRAASRGHQGTSNERHMCTGMWSLAPGRELDLDALELGAWKHRGHDATAC